MIRRCLPSLFLLLSSLASAHGATAWIETGAVIDTVVADTDTAAPANPLAPLAAPVPFKEFRYPHVDDAENATFIADDPVYGPAHGQHGIFRSFAADGHLQTLVSRDDLIPGTQEKFGLIRGLHPDEHGADFVFGATGDGDGETGGGLYLWSGGKVTTIARHDVTVLPGDAAPLSVVFWGAVHAGRVLYAATDAEHRLALVLHDVKTRADRVLLRGGDPVPGHPGEAFHYLSHQNWLGASSVVFRAGTADPGGKRESVRSGLYGWFNVRWDDPATLDPARMVTLADTDTPMPAFGDRRFTDFRSAPVLGGLVAFTGIGVGSRDQGIYFSRDGGPVRPIVDTATELPGLFRGRFREFGIWTTVVENGVVFIAHAGGGFTGVFLYRADRDTLYLLADNRAPLEGRRITDFEVGSRPIVGNRFALTANFADGGSGVYLATVPAHAFRRTH